MWDCIYLTSSLVLADAVVRVLDRAHIRAHPVASLEDARCIIARGPELAVVTEATFLGGGWRDAIEMTKELAPRIPVIVLLREFDGALWVQALTSGAYDVIAHPRDLDRLPRTVVNALQHHFLAPRGWHAVSSESWCRRVARRLRIS